MAELEQGTVIKLLNGKTCTVDSELGRGGQGIVYLVDYCGGDFALKWYTRDYSDSFYNNLKSNADSGAPSNAFLWPLAVTEKQKGSFGYIMRLRPRGYREFGDFMLAKVQFSSMAANINAAIKICDAFQKLHIRGLSYQDMNDGNFFINPRNGDVLICDNDNVAPDKTNLGIIGKAGYLAPEIVDQKTMPNRYSDYFSMAVILFILFYFNRPFEGQKIAGCGCMTEDMEKDFFGHKAVFIMDPLDNSNRPVPGLHTNVIRRWGLFPNSMEKLFIQAFSKQSILFPEKSAPRRKIRAGGRGYRAAPGAPCCVVASYRPETFEPCRGLRAAAGPAPSRKIPRRNLRRTKAPCRTGSSAPAPRIREMRPVSTSRTATAGGGSVR